jgi:hypothetical protein
METSGNAHADFCRGNVIKYGFRKKGDRQKMIDDLKKAEHYAREGWQALERDEAAKNQPELPFDRPDVCPLCAAAGCHAATCPNSNPDDGPTE